MKKSISNYLGNILIILSIFGFGFIFYPVIKIYLFPPALESLENRKGTYLTIKKINAQSLISENVNPLNEKEYQKVLKSSIAHAKGTALPGDPGTTFIFAHSSGPPWDQTRNNTIFLRLNELSKGDEIEITKNGKHYKYLVREKKEVDPTDIKYLEFNNRNQIILQTCTPIGTDYKRLLVFADPIYK